MFGSRVANLLVALLWSAQHCALPLILDWRFVLYRFLAFLPGVAALMYLYARTRRLTPLVIAHWPMDISAGIVTVMV